MSITNIIIQSPAGETVFTDTAMGATIDAIKATSAVVFYLLIDNTLNAGAPVYVKLFNATSGSITLGTTVPDEVIFVPSGQKITHVLFTGATAGKTFATALSAACVTTGGTAGVTAPASNVPVVVVYT